MRARQAVAVEDVVAQDPGKRIRSDEFVPHDEVVGESARYLLGGAVKG
jgi:hypothetical protein